jgi:hypothetical protein
MVNGEPDLTERPVTEEGDDGTSATDVSEDRWELKFRRFALGTALAVFGISILALAVMYFWVIAVGLRNGLWLPIMEKHFLTVFGGPIAVIVSFSIVQLLRGLHGPIVIESKWVTFKGATGPVILWILCFLSVVGAMWLLWVRQ